MPEAADSAQQLQIAIARLFRKQGPRGAPGDQGGVRDDARRVGRLVRGAGPRPPPARGRQQPGRDQPAASTCRLRCWSPRSSAARDHGYLTGEDDRLELTELGHEEIHKVIAGTRAWLAEELSDWGADDDELLSRGPDDLGDPVRRRGRRTPAQCGGCALMPTNDDVSGCVIVTGMPGAGKTTITSL